MSIDHLDTMGARRADRADPAREEEPGQAPAAVGEPHAAVEIGPVGATEDAADEADILVSVPELSLEELSFELQGASGVESVTLQAKALQAGLMIRADLENLVLLAGRVPRGARTDVQGTARTAERPPRRVAMPSREEDGGGAEPDEEDGDDPGLGRRVLGAAKQGGKAATLAAAGAAGARLLDGRGSRGGPGGSARRLAAHLPIPGRGASGQANVASRLRARLPG